jgi:hypothetical protein
MMRMRSTCMVNIDENVDDLEAYVGISDILES